MTRYLVVVGNSPVPSKQLSALPDSAIARKIDSFDVIVRFNEIKNRNASWIGTRTDVLFLRVEGNPAMYRAHQGPWNIPPNLMPKRIILSCDETTEHLYPNLFGDRSRGRVFIRKTLVNAGLTHLRPWVMGRTQITNLMKLLGATPQNPPPYPSLGMAGIHYVMTAPEYADCEIYVTGFTFQGWEGHSWKAEEELVEKWQKSGRLHYLV